MPILIINIRLIHQKDGEIGLYYYLNRHNRFSEAIADYVLNNSVSFGDSAEKKI